MREYDPKALEKVKERETDILWREIFHHPYDNCSGDRLREITKKLMLRMELLKERVPPFFGNVLIELLRHPQLDSLTKEVLINLCRL